MKVVTGLHAGKWNENHLADYCTRGVKTTRFGFKICTARRFQPSVTGPLIGISFRVSVIISNDNIVLKATV